MIKRSQIQEKMGYSPLEVSSSVEAGGKLMIITECLLCAKHGESPVFLQRKLSLSSFLQIGNLRLSGLKGKW